MVFWKGICNTFYKQVPGHKCKIHVKWEFDSRLWDTIRTTNFNKVGKNKVSQNENINQDLINKNF